VPSITGIRLKPHGAEATLVNISETGLLVECISRIKPGTTVIVVFEGTFSPPSVEGRVARSSVAIMHKNGGLGYHTGIAFNQRIKLAGLTSQKAAVPSPKPLVASSKESATPVAAAQPASQSGQPSAPARPVTLVNRW
jgi:hypothetical protein